MWDCNSTQMCTARKHSKHCPPKHHWRANTKYKWNPDAEALSASASEALSGSCTPTRCSSQGKDMFNVQFWGDVQKCTCSHTLDHGQCPKTYSTSILQDFNTVESTVTANLYYKNKAYKVVEVCPSEKLQQYFPLGCNLLNPTARLPSPASAWRLRLILLVSECPTALWSWLQKGAGNPKTELDLT